MLAALVLADLTGSLRWADGRCPGGAARSRRGDQADAVGVRPLSLRHPPDPGGLGGPGHLCRLLGGDRGHRSRRLVVLLDQVRHRRKAGGRRLLHQQPEPAGRGRSPRSPGGVDGTDHGWPARWCWLPASRWRRWAWPASSSFLGLLVCATTGLLVSPITWAHHMVWVVPVLIWLVWAPDRPAGGRLWAAGRRRPVLVGADLEGAQRLQHRALRTRVAAAVGQLVLLCHGRVHGRDRVML